MGLLQRVERYFGGWKELMSALGLRPPPYLGPELPREPHDLADALLGVVSDHTVARITGFTQRAVACRRRWLERDAPVFRDRRLAESAESLGVVSDAEIAERLRITTYAVKRARVDRGLPCPTAVTAQSEIPVARSGRAASATVLEGSRAARRRIEAAIHEAPDAIWALILRERHVLPTARSRRALAEDLSISASRVQSIERRALAALGIEHIARPRARALVLTPEERRRVALAVRRAPDTRWAFIVRARYLLRQPRTRPSIAKELGVTRETVRDYERTAMRRLGIGEGVIWKRRPPDPRRSSEPPHRYRLQIDAGGRATIEKAVRTAPRGARWAKVLRDRFLREPPRTLAALGQELGMQASAIAHLQRRTLDQLGVVIDGGVKRRRRRAR